MRTIGRFAPLLWLVACGQDYNVIHQPPDVDPADVTPCGFSEIPGTQFQRYDCNPVFTNTDEAWVTKGGGVGSIGFHVEEVLGHPIYQMWYATSRKGGTYGLGYAISADGVDWQPLPANPVFEDPGGAQAFNRDSMGAITVVWDDDASKYVLAYQGVNFTTDGNGLGMLSSSDGQDWKQENGGQPFLNLSQVVENVRYCWPLALTWESGIGFQGYINGGPGDSQVCQVYGYGGPDIGHLAPQSGGPILKAGPAAYDQEGTASAAIVKFEDTYYMFYTGIREWQPIPGENFIAPKNTTLNVATSKDGLTFEKSEDNPILAISLVNDPYQIGNVAAQVVGTRIHLWLDDQYDEVGGHAVGYFLFDPHADKY